MTVAAIYARYSSDSQREESIEIQVEHCTKFIQDKGWECGPIYTDYGLTGTNDQRPGFQQAVADGEAGKYDILVVYKTDRFARNILVSKSYKDKLKAAGRRIWSVREGESLDTPEAFFHESLDEIFAEHYSRKLSVDIRNGIQKNAENLKASGVRIFGYDVDKSDHFVINPREAFFVRELFERKLRGCSLNELSRWLESEGIRTSRGNVFSTKTIGKMLHNEAYIGTYKYAGNVVKGGMPAIIDEGTFLMVQEAMAIKHKSRRKAVNHDYILTGKLYCMNCGKPLIGRSGTSKTGKKHPYYNCGTKGGCDLYIPAEKLEDAVMDDLRESLLTDGSVESMSKALDAYLDEEAVKDNIDMLRDELRELTKKRDRLIKSIAAGVDPQAVADAVNEIQKRIELTDRNLVEAEYMKSNVKDSDDLRAFVREAIELTETNVKLAKALFRSYIAKIYADKEHAIVLFTLGKYDEDELTLDKIKAIKETNTAEADGVRMNELWWTRVLFMRTLTYRHKDIFAFVLAIKTDQQILG